MGLRWGAGQPPNAMLPLLFGGGLIGPLLLLLFVPLANLVFTVIAAVKASNGEHYRYPLIIRFIR